MSKYKYTDEEAVKEAKNFETKNELKEQNSELYRYILKRDIRTIAFSHMPKTANSNAVGSKNPNYKYTDEELIKEGNKYKTKGEFSRNNPQMYKAAYRRRLLSLCSFPKNASIGRPCPWKIWTKETISKESLNFTSRKEFQQKSSGAYDAALTLGIMNDICKHMSNGFVTSIAEKDLFNIIKLTYPTATKLIDRKRSMYWRPHIAGFDIDIYIPELKLGIEFDGMYWHSVDFLEKRKPNWPKEDLVNYHSIKDEYFGLKGIKILHIKEVDWNKNKQACIQLAIAWLSDNCSMYLTSPQPLDHLN